MKYFTATTVMFDLTNSDQITHTSIVHVQILSNDKCLPVDTGHTHTESKPLVVHVPWSRRVNHTEHGAASSTDKIHNQTVEGTEN